MIMAIMGILIFGALIAVPRWLQIVEADLGGPGARPTPSREPLRPRWPRFAARDRRRPHGRSHFRGRGAHASV